MAVTFDALYTAIYAVCPSENIATIRVSTLEGVTSAEVVYLDSATDEQRAAANAVAAGWDFSAPAESARKIAADREAAKSAVVAITPAERANRAAQRVVYKSVRGVMQQMNAIRAHVINPANNPMPAALNIRSWKQLLDAVKADIDTETDPET
jgi:hypothetical protein